MGKSRGLSGGGIEGRKVKAVTPVAGKRNVDAIKPGAADQQGQSLGFRGDPLLGTPMADKTDLGNYKAWTCPVGPGGGRTIYRPGYQAQHGAPAKGEKNTSPDPKATRGPRGRALG